MPDNAILELMLPTDTGVAGSADPGFQTILVLPASYHVTDRWPSSLLGDSRETATQPTGEKTGQPTCP